MPVETIVSLSKNVNSLKLPSMKTYEDAIVATVVALLTDLRKAQGLTLEGLAELANVHRTTIGLLERGERHPSMAVAVQLARALGTPLSNVIKQAEEILDDAQAIEAGATQNLEQREAQVEHFHNEAVLTNLTGLTHAVIRAAINNTYHTLDIIDAQLVARGALPIAQLVELANISSMIGNLLGAGVADASDGLYARNRPHHYPDLLPQAESGVDIEVKMALETNSPKGHLVKPGTYLTFRYVLGTRDGTFVRGSSNRGDTAWIWEAKIGNLDETDFSESNTPGDSGKTAVIKPASLKRMTTIYYVPSLLPYARERENLTKDQQKLFE